MGVKMLNLSLLESAIDELEYFLNTYNSEKYQGDPKIVRTATIKAFEFTYELTFKMMERYLRENAASADNFKGATFKFIIRRAYAASITSKTLEEWEEFRKNRNKTSHTYTEKIALEVFEKIPVFLEEARYILKQLKEKVKRLE